MQRLNLARGFVNAQNKRKTEMLVKKVSLKKIADDEVSLSALEE